MTGDRKVIPVSLVEGPLSIAGVMGARAGLSSHAVRLPPSFRDFALVGCEGRQNFGLFTSWNRKMVERSGQYACDRIKFVWRDAQIFVGVLEPQMSVPRPRCSRRSRQTGSRVACYARNVRVVRREARSRRAT